MTALPETMGPMTAPAGRRRRLLTAVHGPLPRSFSGSTWYCAQAGVAEGVLDGAFALSTNKVNMLLHGSTVLWKLARKVRGRKTGGYKFHPTYSDVLWSQHLAAVADTVVINNAQLFGNTFFRRYRSFNVAPCFFIDGTLTEYFGSYGAVEEMNIDDDVVQRAIEMETEGYREATRIVAMSRATERNLIEVYGVAPERIAMVVPGANLDDAAVPAPSTHKGWVGEQFTLGFVGLYPQRKGLDRLAAAMRILRDRGRPICLKVIGRCPPEIAQMDGVSFLGTISKASETARFVDVLRSVDLGCQLSRAELTGIAMMEFLRLGVPIMATATAGMLDILADGGGELVPVDITPEQLAAQLDTLMNEPDRYQALRQAAVRRAEWASWRRVVTELDEALATVH